jgi:hypothetical protein
MAKIHEETVVITLSKLIKDSDTPGIVASNELCDALQAIAEELAGAGIVVEVVRA